MRQFDAPDRCRGISLTEITVVLMLIGIVATITVPAVSSTDRYRLSLAASEIADALRYTRDEALRSGAVHGVQISQTTGKITVYLADLGSSPVGQAAVLYHPLDKVPLDYTLDSRAELRGVSISNAQNPFYYAGYTRLKNLLFDANGLPYWIITGSGNSYLLSEGRVELSYAGLRADVVVDAITGRVRVEE